MEGKRVKRELSVPVWRFGFYRVETLVMMAVRNHLLHEALVSDDKEFRLLVSYFLTDTEHLYGSARKDSKKIQL